jgi:AcrR family transcriptional regulator
MPTKIKADPAPEAETGGAGLRARGKDERRARLIRAARALITERDGANFSMQELATRAGLSLATPYNLLGSKAAILHEVFRTESQGFRDNYKVVNSQTPPKRIVALVDHILSVFAHKPQFYRNLSRNLRALDSDQMRQSIQPLADAMFRPFVEQLIAEDAIVVAVSADTITTHLLRIFESTFLHWAAYDWDERIFRDQLRAGFALAFLGLFDEKNRDALLAELRTIERHRKRLESSRKNI